MTRSTTRLIAIFVVALFALLARDALAQSSVMFTSPLNGASLAVAGGRLVATRDAPGATYAWRLERVPGGGNFYYVRPTNDAGRYLHIQNGRLELAPINRNWWSAMWSIVSLGSGQSGFKNRWKPAEFIQLVNGAPVSAPIGRDRRAAMWQMRQPPARLASSPAQERAAAAEKARLERNRQRLAQIERERQARTQQPASQAEAARQRQLRARQDLAFREAQKRMGLERAQVTRGQQSVPASSLAGRQAQAGVATAATGRHAGAAVASAQPAVAGQVNVQVTNRTQGALLVALAPASADQAPTGLAELAPHSDTVLALPPGARIVFYNQATQAYEGDGYVVGTLPRQAVLVPDPAARVAQAAQATQSAQAARAQAAQSARSNAGAAGQRPPAGTVGVTFRSTSASALMVSSIADGPNATSEGLVELAPRQATVQYLRPGTKVGFWDARANNWAGDFYIVKPGAGQSVVVPIKAGDRNADGVISQAEIKAIAAQVAADVARQQMTQRSAATVCWKDSYGRGVGRIPATLKGRRQCPGGYEPDGFIDAGLCYKKCRPGYLGRVTRCYQQCPKGYTDVAIGCVKPKAIERKMFSIHFGEVGPSGAYDRCRQSAIGKRLGCEKGLLSAFVKCPAGWESIPPPKESLCTPKCPNGMKSDLTKTTCIRDSYERGVGIAKCGGTHPDSDAGLCYKSCNAGYTGVGPVCWNKCPAGWVNCGASCAVDSTSCAMSVTDQVTSPLIAAGSVALIGLTAGSATGATAAAQAGKAAASTAAKIAARTAAKTAAKTALKAKVKALLKSGAMAGVKAGAREAAQDIAMGAAISAAFAAKGISDQNKALRAQVEAQVRAELDSGVSDKQIDAAVELAVEGADAKSGFAENFAWDSLDPTGIASVVVAYNNPICSDVAK
ncbi:MAG: hypothetical protein R3E48_01330 [Burkholderiaceae bacterium]